MARSIIAELERGKRDTTSATWKILKGLLLVDRVEDLWETYTYKDGRFIGSEGTIIKDVQKQEVISDVTLD
jgi:hypothetical protein